MSILTITHTEKVRVQGKNYGNVKTLQIPNITDVYERVFSFKQGTLTTLYTTDDSAISGGVFDDGSIKYVRITSLGAEPMIVEVNSEGNLNKLYELSQGESYYIYSHTLSTFAEGDAIDSDDYTALVDIDSVKAYCVRGAGKVELFIASTDAK
tara:strand:- start:1607 stop:2065 length:459 start_codon:yes stop_codon:yes gene_type:complete